MSNFQKIISLFSILLIIISKFIPAIGQLSNPAIQVLTIFISSLLLWTLVSTKWPSILCILSLMTIPDLGVINIFKSSFINDTFLFLLTTFIFMYALSSSQIIKKLAIKIINFNFSRKNYFNMLFVFLLFTLLIGLFISPTVLFIILFPIAIEIAKSLKLKPFEKKSIFLFLGLAFTISISSGMTPFSHVFSVMAMSFYYEATELEITYLNYMLLAIPIGLILFGALMLFFKININNSANESTNLKLVDKTKVTANDYYILFTTIVVILLWIIPSLFNGVYIFDYLKSLGNHVPPIIGIVLLCIPFKKKIIFKPLASIKNLPWFSLLLAASTLSLGFALSSDIIGIKNLIISTIGSQLNNLVPFILLIIFTTWAALQTNLSSNMVTVTVVTNVAIPILLANNSLSTPAVVSIIGMMGAFAFMTPSAMPHIALSIGGGYVNASHFLKYGFLIMLFSIFITVTVGYQLAEIIFT